MRSGRKYTAFKRDFLFVVVTCGYLICLCQFLNRTTNAPSVVTMEITAIKNCVKLC